MSDRFLERLARRACRSSPTAGWAPRLERRPAAALPRRGEPARTGQRPLAPSRLHPRRRRADRDEHVRREPAKARAHYLEDDVAAINEAAVKIARDAREVSGRDVFIAGSIGPLGDAGDRRRTAPRSSRSRRELLEGRGVDLFMVETFYDLDELPTAIAAVRAVSSLPIVALLTFDEDALTLSGVSARHAPRPSPRSTSPRSARTTALGRRRRYARSSGWARAESRWRRCRTSVSRASPASGIVFPHATPEYFAEFAAHAHELGARIIGGCCGTTPTEIAAIRGAVDEERRPRAPLVVRERELVVAAPRARERDAAPAQARARASSSSPSRSTRRGAGMPTRCSSSRER